MKQEYEHDNEIDFGDARFEMPEHDAYLMRREAEMFAEMDSIDAGTMTEIVKTAALLMGIISQKGN
ncbi:MAG: hypothetical protein KAS66_05490 [Candidatus Omnitrophica bacterium]|nr:hypothetical protein [Candidatus Omnitrophota bacterium]